jgi:uncharacterized protein YbcI
MDGLICIWYITCPMSTTSPETPSESPGGSGAQAASISNALVQLHRRAYGKGPTKAKTYLLDDVVLCILEGGALRIEETLRDHGEEEMVHTVRRTFQAALNDEFRGIIEEATGRPVRAFMSQFDPEHNIGAEIFFLQPR